MEFGTRFALLKSLATVEPSKIKKSQVKEQHNEDECKAGNPDRSSDGCNGRHLRSSQHSTGPHS
jgi:hypothetical protein